MVMPLIEPRPRTTARRARDLTGRRILIADSDAMTRKALTEVLRRDGHDILVAEDGLDLIDAITADIKLSTERGADYKSISLILADASMPGFSGMEALGMLRELEWPTPVILMTAAADSCTDIEAGRLGAAAVLDKPLDLGDVRALIKYITRRASLV
jgi:two-component system response regulator (stage 0 sporulation protein F)